MQRTERRVGLKSRESATRQASNGPKCKIDLILHGPLPSLERGHRRRQRDGQWDTRRRLTIASSRRD